MIYTHLDEAIKNEPFGEYMKIPVYRRTVPFGTEKMCQLLTQAVANDVSVYIDEDCDCDGMFSGLIAKTAFDRIGFKNYKIAKHIGKRHVVGTTYANSLIEAGYKLVLLLDSSTNDVEMLRILCDAGITVCVIDHHTPRVQGYKSYPDDLCIINPKIEELYNRHPEYIDASAGMLCAMVFDYWLTINYGFTNNVDLYLYGYVTMYADACQMKTPFMRAYAEEYRNRPTQPWIINLFLNKWSVLNRSFVSYTLAPRINALIRAEEFDFVYQLFYDQQRLMYEEEYAKNFIKENYERNRTIVKEIIEMGTRVEYENFECLYMHPMHKQKRNYTGLVAARISSETNLVAACVTSAGVGYTEGSIRSISGIEVLKEAQNVGIDADGHGCAFGISIETTQLENKWTLLDQTLARMEITERSVVVIDWDEDCENTVGSCWTEADRLAKYGEVCNGAMQEVYITVTLPSAQFAKYWAKEGYSRCIYDHLTFVSFGATIEPLDKVMAHATYNGESVQLIVDEILSKGNGNA